MGNLLVSGFNILVAKAECPNCRRNVELRVQFKYGDTRQYDYMPGQLLLWGGNDVGEPGHRLVVVDGAGEPCPACSSAADFEVWVEDDHVIRLKPASGDYDFVGRSKAFLVVKP